MNMENYKEAMMSADLAFSNDNYEEALKWYNKALEENPNDEPALSRAGAALVSLGRFQESFPYFEKSCSLAPDNGDAVFNMANAYFFSGDVSKALEYYTKAETMKCSDDVAARIYYQMALMCSIRQDYKSALINYQKYEDADKTGKAALNPEILSEKIQLYLQIDDLENAEKCAAKWVNLAPSELQSYMVYFSLLAANEQYERAEKILNDAEKYAINSEEEQYGIDVSRANLYATAAGSKADVNNDFRQKAYDMMSQLIVSPQGTPESKNELVLALAELCIAMEKTDEAIDLLKMLNEKPQEEAQPEQPRTASKLDPAEIDAMRQADRERMSARLASGEIDESIGELASVSYDEQGRPVREYPDELMEYALPEGVNPETFGLPNKEQLRDLNEKAKIENAQNFHARINFMLLSCYAVKEDYEKALEYARLVKDTVINTYYSFFGRYSEAFSIMQLAKKGLGGFTQADADKAYEEGLAFFRSEMLRKNANAGYALIFRTRMLAETGKFEKAEELAKLMASEDQAAALDYIAQCRSELENG